jgi:penicillin-binding protein 1C
MNRTRDRTRFALLATCVVVIFAVAAFALRPLRASDLPRDAGALVLLDREGAPLGTVLGRDDRHTFAIPLSRMGRWFAPALIAAEDERFFSHGAVDPIAALRAVADGVRAHRLPSGASTIDMQLARTLEALPHGWRGQLAETLLATRIDAGMSKDEILAAYANRAPMGANVYGVEAAARTYFGIAAADLDLAQSATLAALPNAPTSLDPYTHAAALHARTLYVLARMRAAGSIDAEQQRAAASESLDLRPLADTLVAPQFCFFEAARTPTDVSRVRTTVDASLQRFVEAQLRDVVGKLARSDVHQAAAIVIENRTAAVRAYAGSVAYNDSDGGRNDGVQALRQPGSALKPFLYELAMEKRAVRPYDILADVPTAYALPEARLYAPVDYSARFLGPVRPRIALADSLNVPAVRVLERTGVPAFLDRLHALGFAHLDRSADFYGLGLTLGAGEVSLWELARAYLAMERDGVPSTLVTEESDTPPPIVHGKRVEPRFAHAPEWAEVTDIIADPHARAASFGVNSILALPYAAAVKTGTSSDFRDTWTVGFSRDYTVAVWVGNFDGRPMHEISGVTGAGPIWSRIMRHLHEASDPPPLDPPHGWRRTAICTTAPRLWTSACPRADEYLDAQDIATLRALTRADPHPKLGPEFDAWLASQPARRRDGEGARILFPRDGDTFVADERGGATIDVTIGTSDRARARLSLDDRSVAATDETSVVRLARGPHVLRLRAADGRAAARVRVVSAPARRAAFALRLR